MKKEIQKLLGLPDWEKERRTFFHFRGVNIPCPTGVRITNNGGWAGPCYGCRWAASGPIECEYFSVEDLDGIFAPKKFL